MPSLRLTNNIHAEIWHCNLHLHTEANPGFIQLHFQHRLILQINHAAQNSSDLYFATAQSRRESAATKKARRGRVFMENTNEQNMQVLCLLISPQGWRTLRCYSFTTTDGLQICILYRWVIQTPLLSPQMILMNIWPWSRLPKFLSRDAPHKQYAW